MQSLIHGTWTERLLHRPTDDFGPTLRAAASGLTLSACFGLALGARYGGAAMVVGALGVPLGLAAAVAFGGPALYIGVAHTGTSMSARGLASTLASTLGVCGLVLGGLAPAVTLISVSVDTDLAAATTGHVGLAFTLILSLSRMTRMARERLGVDATGRGFRLAMLSFAVFAAVLAMRVWWLAIPMLGRGAL